MASQHFFQATVVRLNFFFFLCVATKQAKTCNDQSHCWLWKYEVFSAWRTVMLWKPPYSPYSLVYPLTSSYPLFPCFHQSILVPSTHKKVRHGRATVETSLNTKFRLEMWMILGCVLQMQTMLSAEGDLKHEAWVDLSHLRSQISHTKPMHSMYHVPGVSKVQLPTAAPK